jgi:dTDP-glucose 4,6-dehydratase
VADRPRLLLTGAAGFLGSHVLQHVLKETDWDVIATDRDDSHKRMRQVMDRGPHERVTAVPHDLTAPGVTPFPDADYVIAMASGVDVSRSLNEPQSFISDNVRIGLSTLDYCRAACPKAVILVSTAEVYGPATASGYGHREWAPILPPSPYAASKAAQEAVAVAYWRSYGVPVVIVNTMNLFGERQDPVKFLPTLVRKVIRGEEVTIYPGSRMWLHAEDLASALLYLLRNHVPARFSAADKPDRFNVAGTSLTVDGFAAQVACVLGKPLRSRDADPVSARPGYEARYALDTGKLAACGWQPRQTLNDSITRTVGWLQDHPEWLEP